MLLRPQEHSDYLLRMYYYYRPEQLTAVENCGLITSVVDNVVFVDTLPNNFLNSAWTGRSADICQGKSPFSIIDADTPIVESFRIKPSVKLF